MGSGDERARARLKSDVYRWYRDEIMPLADFACTFYFNDDVIVKPINGNQGYDAVIYNEDGKIRTKIELCVPHDGKSDFRQAKNINSRGYGDAWRGSPGDEIRQLRNVIVQSAENKSRKDYSKCVLAIIIKCPQIHEEFRDRYLDELNELYVILCQFNYKCDEVYLFCDSVGYLKRLKR